MDWKQKRIEDLETSLFLMVGLLGEYERKLTYEDDPIGIEKLKNQIQKLSQELEKSHNKLEEFKRSQLSKEDVFRFKDLNEDAHEMLLEEATFSEEAGSSSAILPEAIYATLSEEVKAVVEELKERLNKAKGKTFTFLLIGRTGVGKSSTLNSLMGAEVAPVNDFDPCTTDIDIHETSLHGAIVRVIDTPGLCDTEGSDNDAQYIELIRQKIQCTIDAVLFVSRLNEPRVDASEQRGLRLITEAFGELFWKKAVIVFTCSDMVSASRFEEYLDERTKRIHAALLKLQLSNDTVCTVPSVAVDNTNLEKINPDGQTWIQQLYLTVLDRIEDSSKDVFILSTSHMLEKIRVSPLTMMKRLGVSGLLAGNTAGIGAIVAHSLGVGAPTALLGVPAASSGIPAGLFLISNPAGWAIVLTFAAIGGVLTYKAVKDAEKRDF